MAALTRATKKTRKGTTARVIRAKSQWSQNITQSMLTTLSVSMTLLRVSRKAKSGVQEARSEAGDSQTSSDGPGYHMAYRRSATRNRRTTCRRIQGEYQRVMVCRVCQTQPPCESGWRNLNPPPRVPNDARYQRVWRQRACWLTENRQDGRRYTINPAAALNAATCMTQAPLTGAVAL
jgi:hypothetical protein